MGFCYTFIYIIMSTLNRREALRLGAGAAAGAGLAAVFGRPREATAASEVSQTEKTIRQLVEAGHLREGVGNINWAPLSYVDGDLAPGQVHTIADYMNAAMVAGASRTVNTRKEYVRPPTVTPQTNPFALHEVNEIVAAMQVTAAHVQGEFVRENGLEGTDVRTRYGADANENPRADQVKFRLDAGASVVYAHHPDRTDNATAITNLHQAWQIGKLDGVYIMTNQGEIRMEHDTDGNPTTPILRASEDYQAELTGLADVLKNSQLGSGDAQYLLALVLPNAECTAQALGDPGIGAELYIAPNTHSYETFPVR